MRAIGARAGKRVTCVLTDMDAPLGRTIGNALEIRESIEVLRGGGPADTRELTHRARRRDAGARPASPAMPTTAARGSTRALDDGSRARGVPQGGRGAGRRPARVDDSPGSVLPQAGASPPSSPLATGRVVAIDARGARHRRAACSAPAGARKEDAIDPAARASCSTPTSASVIEPAPPLAVILHHSLAAGDARVAEARAHDRRDAFAIEPRPPRRSAAQLADPRGDPMTDEPIEPRPVRPRPRGRRRRSRARARRPPPHASG